MSIADLQAIEANFDNAYFGQSDRSINRQLLQEIIEALLEIQASVDTNDAKIDELDLKIDALEERVEALEG